jgi:hypothetical protein
VNAKIDTGKPLIDYELDTTDPDPAPDPAVKEL